MRSTEERMLAVRGRSRRLRRHRGERTLAVLVLLMAFPLVDLAGRYAAGNLGVTPATDSGLLGAASLFGASAGGYVLAAVVAAIIAVAVTALLMMRHRANEEKPSAPDAAPPSSSENDSHAQ